jgi:hypothetical protein
MGSSVAVLLLVEALAPPRLSGFLEPRTEGKESEMPVFSSSIAATYFRFIYF